jgi:hypothetical protein
MDTLRRLLMRRLLLTASVLLAVLPTAASAQATGDYGPRTCSRTFSLQMFDRAATSAYSGTDLPARGTYGHLWRYARCVRPPGTTMQALAIWKARYHAWEVRRNPPLPYGNWAIPSSIVQCESTFQNLPPNSASASGYYQIVTSTWLAYGGGRYASQAYLASKSEQDVIAARIWDGGNGARQWVCKA